MRLRGACLALLISTMAIASIRARASAPAAAVDAGIALPEAVDPNADPHIVEINLESRISSVDIAPGTRADAIVTPQAAPGRALVLQAQLFDRGYGTVEYRQPEDLL